MCNCCWKTESQKEDVDIFFFVSEKNLLSMIRALTLLLVKRGI